jgi:glycerol-3-phosphate O-acyltransferase
MRLKDKEKALTLVKERVCREILGDGDIEDMATNHRVEAILGETIFYELARVESEKRSRSQRKAHQALLERRRELFKTSAWGRRVMLADFIEEFSNEVLGNFDERVYGFATRILPLGLSTLLNAMSPGKLVRSLPEMPSIEDRAIVNGEVELVKGLESRGTIVYAPTHLSNLDSIIIGYSLYSGGLKPATYGAGINLFSNPMMSFFMHNLGAYTVDRKKKCSLYKRVLKEYATVSMEMGYPNLFFPGGTRSRSGKVESKLKLGLLGCGIRAYINNLINGKEQANLYVVPINLSYQLVLEADSLISDELKAQGKSRSIITDDEFAQPTRVLDFVQSLFKLDARIVMTFGAPLDPFGNRVDAFGRSHDKHGREVDTTRYVVNRDGQPCLDQQRDEEYTRELGAVLRDAFMRGNTLMSTHLIALIVFVMMRRRHKDMDIYRFIRESRLDDEGLSMTDLERIVAKVQERAVLLAAAGKVRIDGRLGALNPHTLLMNGLKHLGIYHASPVIERRGDRVFVVDSKLLYYYRNRAIDYGFEEVIE